MIAVSNWVGNQTEVRQLRGECTYVKAIIPAPWYIVVDRVQKSLSEGHSEMKCGVSWAGESIKSKFSIIPPFFFLIQDGVFWRAICISENLLNARHMIDV